MVFSYWASWSQIFGLRSTYEGRLGAGYQTIFSSKLSFINIHFLPHIVNFPLILTLYLLLTFITCITAPFNAVFAVFLRPSLWKAFADSGCCYIHKLVILLFCHWNHPLLPWLRIFLYQLTCFFNAVALSFLDSRILYCCCVFGPISLWVEIVRRRERGWREWEIEGKWGGGERKDRSGESTKSDVLGDPLG